MIRHIRHRGKHRDVASAISLPKPDSMHMRALEPRILLDAAAVETAVDAAQQAIHSDFADTYVENNFPNGLEAPGLATSPVPIEDSEALVIEAENDGNDTQRTEIAFIDAGVPDIETLIAALPSGTEIVLLDASRDGIEQISQTLATRTQISAIHLISHGDQGELNLGAAVLDAASMNSIHRELLVDIGKALTDEADILIYGCDFAAGISGQKAVELLSYFTGADVAASTDATGHADLGGDWDLELQRGSIETEAFDAELNWFGLLADATLVEHTISNFNDRDHDEAIGSGRVIGQTFEYDSGSATYEVGKIELVLRNTNSGSAENHDIIISLRETFDGAIIAQGTLKYSEIGGSYTWETFVLDSTATLNSNQTYYIVADASNNSQQIEVAIDHDVRYSGGDYIQTNGQPKNGNDDMLFRVIDTTANGAPTITSDGGSLASLLQLDENQLHATTITAIDNDIPADTLTYSITNGWDSDLVTIDENTGEVFFKIAPDFENPTDIFANNIIRFDVAVSDGRGGTDTDTVYIKINDANDLPVATDMSATTTEDTPIVLDGSNFMYTDDDGQEGVSISVSNLALNGGTLAHTGGTVPVTNGTTITLAELADLTFTPGLNSTADATFNYTVNDAENGTVAGLMTINITPVNDVPVATGGAVTIIEDVPHTFIVSEFGFTDVEGDALQSIIITNLDLAGGTLTHSAGVVPVTNGMIITLAELADLTFTPALNSTANATFDYSVNDAESGFVAAQMAITVTPVNDAPVATGGAVSTDEDTELVFVASDFAYSDIESDALQSVTISNLTLAGGTLTHSGGTVPVTDGMTISLAELADLTFSPALNSNVNATFDYTVNDADSGTVAAQMVISVTPLNDTPVATGGAVTTDEDVSHVFDVTEFGFSDIEGDALQSVTLTNLNLAGGTLTHSGGAAPVTNGTTIPLAELVHLTYTPALNSTANASFDYSVNDANNGTVTAQMTITVTPVNDLAVATGGGVTTDEDVPHVFSAAEFNFSDIEDDALQSVKVSNLALAGGTLTHSGGAISVTNGSTITLAQLADLTFTPVSNSSANATFDYTVNDADSGTVAAQMAITVRPINDPSVATGGAVTTNEDVPHIFNSAEFNFSDIEGDALQSVTVSNLALNGGNLAHTGGTVSVTNGSTITLAELADLTFTPSLNSTANATFDYTVNDTDDGIVAAQMMITVLAVNDAPVATGGAVTTDEDVSHVFAPVEFGFSDVEGDAAQSITVSNLALAGGTLTHTGGTVSVTNGSTITLAQLADLTFTPALNSTDNASFDYTVNDADIGIVTAQMAITVTPMNDTPVATGGAVSTDEDTQLVFAATDFAYSDTESDSLQSVTISNLALAGGTLTHSGATVNVTDGMTITLGELADLTFAPALNSTANATFDYTVNDADNGTVASQMVITVTPLNDLAVAIGGAVSTDEDVPHVFDVTEFSFSDIEGDALQSVTLTNLSLAGGALTHSSATVNVTDGMTITLTELADLTFTPALNSSANATFDYTVNDANSGTVSAQMAITVTPVNDAPVITSNGGLASVSIDHVENQTAATTVTANDVDSLVGSLRYSISGGTAASFFNIDPVSGELSFKVAPDFENPTDPWNNNTYYVNVMVTDDFGATSEQELLFRIINGNDAPVATGGAVTTAEDIPFVFNAADFAFLDNENDALQSVTITDLILSGGTLTHSGGTVSVTNGMEVTLAELTDLTFTPAANSTTPASFHYTVNDTESGIVSAQMDITVTPVNDAPIATGGTVNTDEDNAFTFAPTDFGFTDIENDPLKSIVINNIDLDGGTLTHSGGTVSVTNGMTITLAQLGDLIFAPAANSSATASFSYLVNDDDAGTTPAQMMITVDPVNDAPIATGGSITAIEDTAYTFLASDFGFTDLEGDALQAITIGNLSLSGGTLTHSAGTISVTDGMAVSLAELADLTYVSAPNSSASASFDYSVSDDDAGTSVAQMSITVLPANDAPVATGGVINVIEDISYTFTPSEFSFTDIEGDALQSITLSNMALHGGTLTHSSGTVVVTDGMTITLADLSGLKFTPALNSNAQATFDYTVNDADGGTSAARMSIDITPVDDAPEATGGSITAMSNEAFIIDPASFGYFDAEGDAVQSITITNLDLASGSLTHSSGSVDVTDGMMLTAVELADLTFTSALNSTSPATFEYVVNGTVAGTVAATFTINVSNPPEVLPIDEGGGGIDEQEETTDEKSEADSEEDETAAGLEEISPEDFTTAPPSVGQAPGSVLQLRKVEPVVAAVVQVPGETTNPTYTNPITKLSVPPTETRAEPITYKFAPVDQKVFTQQLKKTGEDVRQHNEFVDVTVANVSFAFSSLLSVGGVSFVLRGGALAAALMSAIPAWGKFDPISVVTGRKDDSDGKEISDVDMMLEFVRDARARVKEDAA